MDDLKDAKKWLLDEVNEDTSKLAMNILKHCVFMSPVDSGRFRGNWIVSVNSQSDVKVESDFTNTIEKGAAVLDSAKSSNEKIRNIYIQNNLEYATVIDDGLYPNPPKTGDKTIGGYSKQAPNGVSRPAIMQALKDSEKD